MFQDVVVLLGFELLREHNGFAAYLWEKSSPTCDQREAPDLEGFTNVLRSFSYTSIAILTRPCSNTHTLPRPTQSTPNTHISLMTDSHPLCGAKTSSQPCGA